MKRKTMIKITFYDESYLFCDTLEIKNGKLVVDKTYEIKSSDILYIGAAVKVDK